MKKNKKDNCISTLLKCARSLDIKDDDICRFVYLLCEDDTICVNFFKGFVDVEDLEYFVGKCYIIHRFKELDSKYNIFGDKDGN